MRSPVPGDEALKKSEANLRTIFDNTDSAYILIDADLHIVSFNALAQKYSEEQNKKSLEVSRSIKYYFGEERWPFIVQTLERVAAGENISYELNFVSEDGIAKWYDVRWLNVKNNEGKNWGFILANNNITATKTLALERERITADLIQHNSHLEQFTYIVSHNLRAPVANIIGLTDILKEHDDLDPGSKHEIVERLSQSVKNIDTVIKDLNSILQARRPVNEQKETVYFKELCDDIITNTYNIIIKENAQLKCSFEDVDSLFTIRSYLYSIFYNLVSNSIKYRQTGIPPVISITSRKTGNKVELRFKDNGKGIDLKKNGSQLFGLYKRFDTTAEGKGMGLFMVKTQVEALGGGIKVSSKPGEGTEFIIQLNLKQGNPGV
jgi:PAS domain S-box-containing protein